MNIDACAHAGQLMDMARCLSTGALFVTAKIPIGEIAVVHALEELGFHVVDVALTFRCNRLENMQSGAARFVKPEDRDRIVDIARNAFTYSRFHLDPMIPDVIADRIKAEWAGNYFAGQRGDAMVTVEADGRVAGFLQLLKGQEDDVVVDLIAVEPMYARRGLARAMIGFAANHGIGDGVRPASMVVGTQAANTPSVNLYEASGFRLSASVFVLHHHGTGVPFEQPQISP